jgi:hypothetical protein
MSPTTPNRIEHHLTAQGNLPGRQSAIALLARSIDYGHRHIAAIRFAMAVSVGAEVPVEQRNYCEEVAATIDDPALRALLATVMHAASTQAGALAHSSLVGGEHSERLLGGEGDRSCGAVPATHVSHEAVVAALGKEVDAGSSGGSIVT